MPTVLVFAAFLAILSVCFPLGRPVLLDPATWDYMSVEVARGLIPYRDIFLHKTPGAAVLGAFGATVASAVGADPIDGAHFLFRIFGAAAAALLANLVARRSSWPVGIAAALFLFAFDPWLTAVVEGVRPKVATVAFGLAAILAAENRRPLWAGVAGAVSTLCWQPGVAFLGGAALTLAVGSISQGDNRRRLVTDSTQICLGAALPVAVLLSWLAVHDAFFDFWRQAVGFNFSYVETMGREASDTASRVLRLLRQWAAPEILLATTIVPAAVLHTGALRSPAAHYRQGLLPIGLVFAGAAYLAMTFVSRPPRSVCTPW